MLPIALSAAMSAFRTANVLSGGALTGLFLGTLSTANAPTNHIHYQRLKLGLISSPKSKAFGQNIWALQENVHARPMGFLRLG